MTEEYPDLDVGERSFASTLYSDPLGRAVKIDPRSIELSARYGP